ncbi:MAG: LysR family transcriptional regulator [Myxococcota bacterium]
MSDLDWKWLKSFLAVAEAGGTALVGPVLSSSQSTLSRHVRQLEAALGVDLFERTGQGLLLSPGGREIYEYAAAVRQRVVELEGQALRLSESSAGPARITMSRLLGLHFGPGWISALAVDHPELSVDLVLDDQEVNLLRRDAEIAVRMFKPTQSELRLRRCTELRVGFFISDTYRRNYGEPASLDELKAHRLIGFDRLDYWNLYARKLGFHFDRKNFAVRTDSTFLHAELAKAGVGLAALPIFVGGDADLLRVLPDVSFAGQTIYLAAHPELRRNRRLSAVWAHLSRHLSALS